MKNKDYVEVQFYSEKTFWLYIGFDEDTLNSATDRWQYRFEEGRNPCTMMMNCNCFELKVFEGGFGFIVTDLWENRLKGIEDLLGECLY